MRARGAGSEAGRGQSLGALIRTSGFILRVMGSRLEGKKGGLSLHVKAIALNALWEWVACSVEGLPVGWRFYSFRKST